MYVGISRCKHADDIKVWPTQDNQTEAFEKLRTTSREPLVMNLMEAYDATTHRFMEAKYRYSVDQHAADHKVAAAIQKVNAISKQQPTTQAQQTTSKGHAVNAALQTAKKSLQTAQAERTALHPNPLSTPPDTPVSKRQRTTPPVPPPNELRTQLQALHGQENNIRVTVIANKSNVSTPKLHLI